MRNDIQAAFSGELFPLLRHEASVIGTDIFGKGEHRRGYGHLQIELGVQALAQDPHISLLNMAPVFAQVHRDAVGAGGFGQQSGFDRIRHVYPPRLAHGRNVVDIDSQANQSFTPISVRISSAISCAMAQILSSSSPSNMIRASISVPE